MFFCGGEGAEQAELVLLQYRHSRIALLSLSLSLSLALALCGMRTALVGGQNAGRYRKSEVCSHSVLA